MEASQLVCAQLMGSSRHNEKNGLHPEHSPTTVTQTRKAVTSGVTLSAQVYGEFLLSVYHCMITHVCSCLYIYSITPARILLTEAVPELSVTKSFTVYAL
jgi:hypothetical protein